MMEVAETVELFSSTSGDGDVPTVILAVAVISDLESTPLTAIIYVPFFVGVHVNVLEVEAACDLPSEVVKAYFTVPELLEAFAVNLTAVLAVTVFDDGESVSESVGDGSGKAPNVSPENSFLSVAFMESPAPLGY